MCHGWGQAHFEVEGFQQGWGLLQSQMMGQRVIVWQFRGRRGLYVHLHVFAQGAWVGVGLGAAQGLAVIGLRGRVHLGVLLSVAAVGKTALTKLTLERLLTSVGPRVNLEVL